MPPDRVQDLHCANANSECVHVELDVPMCFSCVAGKLWMLADVCMQVNLEPISLAQKMSVLSSVTLGDKRACANTYDQSNSPR